MNEAAQVLEVIMVLAFGASWPFSIATSWRSRTTKGKNLLFLLLIELGYICGILAKIAGDNITYVFPFYVLNLLMVGTDILLYFRNRRLDEVRA